MHYLISACVPCSLIPRPPPFWFPLFSPRLTPPDFSSLRVPPLLKHFHVFPFCETPQVSLALWNFFFFFFFPGARREKLSCFLPRKAFSSWRSSRRGSSQTMTAIVKGQISPCGFASDCMFISFWSGRDSKPLSRSPHSPNSWSSACHWNRLMADPGDRGGGSGCLSPNFSPGMEDKLCCVSLFPFIMWLSYWPVCFSSTQQYEMKHTDCRMIFSFAIRRCPWMANVLPGSKKDIILMAADWWTSKTHIPQLTFKQNKPRLYDWLNFCFWKGWLLHVWQWNTKWNQSLPNDLKKTPAFPPIQLAGVRLDLIHNHLLGFSLNVWA